ncbi:EVE domain-containing protein [Polaribacter sp. R77954]|uniref:EVE domain-containing protein n=1 Tax=Polaribacter sp. R77954 TaxID=3093870 RepID=UPI0037C5D090
MNENLHKLKQEFLAYWSLEKLKNMSLEEYTDTNRENSFCYWLEHITRDLGSIVGGSSYKFGIYKMGATSKTESATNRTNDGFYAWHTKYGATKEDAFTTIKSIIISIANYAQQNNLQPIDDIDLGNAYKWKIAFLYGDYNCVNMFKLDALRIIAGNLNIKYNNKTSISYFHKAILELKPKEQEYFTYCHHLWKQYQERQVDVKKDFAKWLNKNTFDSYRNYLGYSNQSIEEKLIEINSFFDEIDFFLVDPKKINALISTIMFLLNKKERAKNLDFIEYDSKNSNGIPKAILGKNNYIKFLKEKFEYKTPNYWIFQGNPNIYDIKRALKAGHLKSWKVAAHKDKIKIGDQVIIWQTGENAGCYALAEVTSEVSVFEEENYEQKYYVNSTDSESTERVKIRILKYLAEDPILWEELKDNLVFSEFKAGNQGTNFSATQIEFETLLNWNRTNNIKYWLYSPGGNADHWDEFFEANIMAIGWDRLGDLKQYKSKDEIKEALDHINGNSDRKPNKVTANYEFANTMQIGDVIIVKQGRSKLLGYGVVTSDYFFDSEREGFKSCRKVDWKLKGEWHSEHKLVLKTLTDVTIYDSEYEKYDKYSDYLMALMTGGKKQKIAEKIITDMKPINQILYGPPGTGKTYYLKEQLFDKYTLKEEAISKEKYFEEVVTNITWWQAITLALIEEGKSKVSDILKNRWVATKANLSESKNVRATIWGTLQMHTIEESTNVNYKQRQAPLIFDKEIDKSWILLDSELKEQSPEIFKILENVNNFVANADSSIKHYDFVTFHQSFAYEDFIEGIKPVMPENEEETADLGYAVEDGVFKRLCLRAKNDPENRYAIFIDEINRGNVSAIFGELITLIETDKRSGAKNEISIKLPYSKKEFNVPSNLDIYGTMNTADRSIEALDTALRRRFTFLEIAPKPELFQDKYIESINLEKLLSTINNRIELLIDKDHKIGHSYFLNIESLDDLKQAFKKSVIPLLEEYFFGDYGKIGLVLGSGFIQLKDDQEKVTFAKNFTEVYEDAENLREKAVYTFTNEDHWDASSFLSIYE